jgi:HPr kinase/phosphorylase
MPSLYTVNLKQLYEDLKLELIFIPENVEKIEISNVNVNLPGLPLAGFYNYFDNTRIQVIGNVEYTYLLSIDENERAKSLDKFMSTNIPAIIVTRGLDVYPEMLNAAKKHNVTILRTNDTTSSFMSTLIAYLSNFLAVRITRHGVLVEVYGEGILLLGESGVGKSETAMELLKRGHRLIADDAVEIKRVSNKTLVGVSPEIIRHFIELRGIGIIDVRRIFGMGAIKESEKINLVIEIENWDDTKFYERLGLESQTTNILGIEIPLLKIPVKPGRNLAIIIEVAAMNNRQKRLGYNAAEELNSRIMNELNSGEKK